MHNLTGRVLSIESNLFAVDTGAEVILCSAEKKIKAEKDKSSTELKSKKYSMPKIVAGDIVELKKTENDFVITRVLPRKNSLIRPAVANVDQIVFVLAVSPKPDFFLLDKLIINCFRQSIPLIVCLNKTDICSKMLADIKAQYGSVATAIILTSAKSGEVESLKKVLRGKLTPLSGQSAVGKSSLINALKKKDIEKTQELSKKIERGKNTTTRARLIRLSNKSYIVDTPGFSMLDIFDIDKKELKNYYPEFIEFASGCKFSSCTHSVEPSCSIKAEVEGGGINKDRYLRYLKLLASGC